MSALRSAIDELVAQDFSPLSDPELEARYEEYQRAAQVLEAGRLRCLAEIERRRSYERDGHLSATAWLMDRHGVSGGAAAQDVKVATALEHKPATREH